MQFIDLKAQYRALKTEIDEQIQAVLEAGQYIGGPQVKELEQKLAEYVGRKHCSITYDATYSKYLICVFSQNGVVLPNGNRIKDGERAVLSVGSAIELGNKDNVLELY